MKLRPTGICMIAALAGAVGLGFVDSAFAADKHPQRLRVLSYNIHHGEGTDGSVDLERQANVIRQAKPDLVALQEVDDRTMRTGAVDQTARLAELTGLNSRFAKQIDYEGGGYGQALLSRFPLSEVAIHWLPGHPERERRIAAAVTVELENAKLIFVTTHLHHANELFRKQQAEQLNSLFGGNEEPVILAGDLNATPKSDPLLALGSHWKSATADMSDPFTFPVSVPDRQLDYVLFRPSERFHVVSTKVLDEKVASDHRPLLVELELR